MWLICNYASNLASPKRSGAENVGCLNLKPVLDAKLKYVKVYNVYQSEMILSNTSKDRAELFQPERAVKTVN